MTLKPERAKASATLAHELGMTREDLVAKIARPFVEDRQFICGGVAVDPSRVQEVQVNPKIGDLPGFHVTQNGSTIEQGNAAGYSHFDKPILNLSNNALLISFAPHASAMHFSGPALAPVRYRLQAAASDSLDRIVLVGDLGELTSEQLAGSPRNT